MHNPRQFELSHSVILSEAKDPIAHPARSFAQDDTGADYANSHHTLDACRGRCIASIAD